MSEKTISPEIAASKTASVFSSNQLLAKSYRVLFAFIIVGILCVYLLRGSGLDVRNRTWPNVYYYLFSHYEMVMMGAWLGLIAVLSFPCRNQPVKNLADPSIIPILLGVGVIASLGTYWVMGAYPLAMDEFVVDFQAAIFRLGKLNYPIPPSWWEFQKALTPYFVISDFSAHSWMGQYFPGCAFIRYLFGWIHLQALTNTFFAVASLGVMSALCRQLWPGRNELRWMAVVLLGTSSQFLITSMTAYSMPIHLFFSLGWLWLYLKDRFWGYALLPLWGGLALGVHQYVVHGLFAAPFCLRLVRERKWGWALYVGAVYVGSYLLWLQWQRLLYPHANLVNDSHVLNSPGIHSLFIQILNSLLLVLWIHPFVIILTMAALFRWKSWDPFVQDLFLSVALTFLFYIIYPIDQGHGWGYRYCYSILGNLVLIACWMWHKEGPEFWKTGLRPFYWCSLFALFVALPYRCWEARDFTRPFVQGAKWIHARKEPVVLVDSQLAWYGWDFVRNQPDLSNSPKIMFSDRLAPEQKKRLFEQGAYEVTRQDMEAVGMSIIRYNRVRQ